MVVVWRGRGVVGSGGVGQERCGRRGRFFGGGGGG